MITRGGAFAPLLAWPLALTLLLVTATRAQQHEDLPSFSNIDEHFRYGSVGTEEGVGLPYWIWRVLPQIFEDKLPKRPGTGYERIGFMREPSTAEPGAADWHLVSSRTASRASA